MLAVFAKAVIKNSLVIPDTQNGIKSRAEMNRIVKT